MTHMISRRDSLKLGLAGLASPLLANTALAAPRPVLVELFTSQGCSSCPPADEVLGEIKKDPNIYAVSLNVDYWDYLGWRDTLAKPEYTQRQKAYAQLRGDGQVYTPQVVVNGAAHAVGSRKSSVTSAITEAKAASVAIALSTKGGDMVIDIGQGVTTGDDTLWLMAIESDVKQKIERGENAGLDHAYHNVVRHMLPVGRWNGAATRLTAMKKSILDERISSVIAVLQSGDVGPVHGLARWERPSA